MYRHFSRHRNNTSYKLYKTMQLKAMTHEKPILPPAFYYIK